MRKLALALLLTSVASVAYAAKLAETIDQTLDVKPGSVLTLQNVNGRIAVSSWDQPRVRVRAEKVVERTDASDAKAALAELRVEIVPQAGGLLVRTIEPRRNKSGIWDAMFGNFSNGHVEYDITVPSSMSVDVTNTNGSVTLRSLSGALKVETTNGRVEMVRCAGSADIETTNGGIRAQLDSVTPQTAIRMETTNGGIDLALPPSIAADIDASTTNGGINSELPVTTKTTSHHQLTGSINGGGARVKLSTTNGGIAIRAIR